MAWFDTHAGSDPHGFLASLDASVEASGLRDALTACAGPVGLRRFVVRAEQRDGRVRVVGIDAPRLPQGGGPPSHLDQHATALEAALSRLRHALPAPATFQRVAIGLVRDAEGEPEVSLRFDQDGDGFGVSGLRLPSGPCAPMEDPAYLKSLASWTARVDEVRRAWRVARGDWAFENGQLDDGERHVSAVAIGTWHAGQARFSWMLAEPAGEEGPFVEPDVFVDLAGATELACFAAARLGLVGVFQGMSEQGQQFFAGVRG